MALAALLAAVVLSAGAGPEIVVTRDSATLPSGCTPRETAELLVRFADAVNSGDTKALRRVFALEDGDHVVWRPEPYFRWYSVNADAVYDLEDLWPYFAARHRLKERWHVVGVQVAGGSELMPYTAAVAFVIRREADDLPAGLQPFAHGKGEVDCTEQRIFVWSMGYDPAHTGRPPCPLPDPWTPGNPVVACAQVEYGAGERSGPNARAIAAGFRIVQNRARLPARCGPRAVTARVRSALTAFNAGKSTAFARHFVRARRAAMRRLADDRYAAGHGWTAQKLVAPRRLIRGAAPYRLELLLSAPGQRLRAGAARLTVDCRSGLFRSWNAPSSR